MKRLKKWTKENDLTKSLDDVMTSGGTTAEILHQIANIRRTVLLKRIKNIIKEIEELED